MSGPNQPGGASKTAPSPAPPKGASTNPDDPQSRLKRDNKRRVVIIALTAVLAMAVYYLLPSSMNELARRAVAIFVVAAVFWATEVLPLYATSLMIVGMEILFLAKKGGLAGALPGRTAVEKELSYGQFLEPFSSSIIILFMGGFLLSAAVTKHGLDKQIAAKIIRPFAKRPTTLVFGILGITAFFSMWMSNTATTAMMLAIIAPVVLGLPREDTFHRAVVLAVPFGANIGGIGTPIGTPPNAVAMAALREAGYQIGFIDWLITALPLAVLLLFITGWLLIWFFPPGKGVEIPKVQAPKGKISWNGRLTLIILLAAILLWTTDKWHGVAPSVVALLTAAALTALRVLDKRDVDSIDWNVLILMWGGLSLGKAMELTGLITMIEQLPIANLGPFALASAFVIVSVVLSTFMSNTATANLLVPMALALSVGNAAQLVILTGLACSFAMAMPVSTPPNAMAFATGKVPALALVRAGTVISLICTAVLLLGYQFVLPLFLDLSPSGVVP